MIEAISADIDLTASYRGMSYSDLSFSTEAVSPVDISVSISGGPKEDLLSFIHGFTSEDFISTLSGFIPQNLKTTIGGYKTEDADVSSTISGFRGLGIETELFGYISPTTSSDAYFDASYKIIPAENLNAIIEFISTSNNINADIEATSFAGRLDGSITATGGFKSLSSKIMSSVEDKSTLFAYIDGTGIDSLIASINDSTQSIISASIVGSGYKSDLSTYLMGNSFVNLQGEYVSISGNILDAFVEPIVPGYLTGVIRPKLFYIDSSIPINTYPFKELYAVINGDGCGFSSGFDDLRVEINAIHNQDLSTSIVTIVGQLVNVHDQVEVILGKNAVNQDWVFLINNPLCVLQDAVDVIITSHPYGELKASIIAMPENSDINASIEALFYRGVASSSSPIIGEWLNPVTGERRVIRVYFRGDTPNYYYSSNADRAFANISDLQLEIVVETYKSESAVDEDLLLVQKQDVKSCTIRDLSGFSSIDEAVRFAITCALSEVHMDLAAVIFGSGSNSDLAASIDSVEGMRRKILQATYSSISLEAVDRLLTSIDGTGGYDDLKGYIKTIFSDFTNSFVDEGGINYEPRLILNNSNSYSIVLLPTDSRINYSTKSPDLFVSIRGITWSELPVTITGVL